ncbi:MAG TPA: cache domain-containing protein, partial [Humidesulfovibrio sp.]|uniref:cache domain-containing protein n=1 Tax=Humidesulfovibrio sp. TaxID=2910988 RepID=UPI002CD2FF17
MARIKSLGTLLIASVAIIVVLGVSAILVTVTTSTYNLALQKEQQSLQQAGQAAQRGLDQYCGNALSLVRSMGTDPQVLSAMQADPAKATARLKDVVKASPDVWSILVFDEQGVVRAGVNAQGQSLAGQSRADRDYYKAIMSGKEYHLAKNILLSKTGGEDMFIFTAAQAIKDSTGKNIGGVGVFVRWSAFLDKFITPLHFGERGYAFMIDGQGNIVAHAMDKSLILKSVADQAFIKEALAKKNGDLFYEWKGDKKYLSFSTDEETGFVVCTNAYVDDLTHAARQQRNMLLGIGAVVVLLLCGGIAFMVRRLVVAPINDIKGFTLAVTEGDFKAKLHTNFRFELADLAHNIRGMVAEIKSKLGFSQGVLDGFVLPCAAFDKDNKTTFVNERMLAALERPGKPADYLGQASGQMIFGDASRETLSARALKENRMLQAEANYTTPSGAQKIFDVTSTPIHDLDGNLLGTLAVWFELTDIRAQQKKIEEQNARIAQAAAAANTVSDQVASASEQLAAQIEQSSRGTDEQRAR